LFAIASSCYRPMLGDTAFACQDVSQCPSGFACGSDGCCHRLGTFMNTGACFASDGGPGMDRGDVFDVQKDTRGDGPLGDSSGDPAGDSFSGDGPQPDNPSFDGSGNDVPQDMAVEPFIDVPGEPPADALSTRFRRTIRRWTCPRSHP